MYSNTGDGLKNYFTLQTYITQPASEGYVNYNAMQYPYGEYVWYTDNSPLFAIAIRWIHLNITPLQNPIAILHWMLFLNMLLAPIFVLRILKQFIKNEWLIILGALVMVWTSPQFFRMFIGHYNLSFSIFYFIAIYWVIKWYFIVTRNEPYNAWKLALTPLLLLMAAAFIHLYYILLLGLPLALFVIITISLHFKTVSAKWRALCWPLCGMLLAAVLVMLVIRSTDGYIDLRVNDPDGKNIPAWEARFFHFYKAKADINTISFLGGTRNYEPENAPYLGSLFWFGFLLLFIAWIAMRFKNKSTKFQAPGKLFWVSVLTTILVFFSARGNQLGLFGLDNYLNPLYYLGKLYPPIVHFRCIGRITWWIFYFAQIGILVGLDKTLAANMGKRFNYVLPVLFVLVFIDINDMRKFYLPRVQENIFNAEHLESIPDINYNDYQAILPLPYYTVGSERYHYTIDEKSTWFGYNCQLQIKSGLPNMAVRLSRTPPVFVEEIFSIFIGDTISPDLYKRLSDKPILVIYDTTIIHESRLEPAATVAREGASIITKYPMELVAEDGNVKYYKWQVK